MRFSSLILLALLLAAPVRAEEAVSPSCAVAVGDMAPPTLLTGLTFSFRYPGMTAADIPAYRERESRRVLDILRHGVPITMTDLTGVEVRTPVSDLLADPRAAYLDPETRTVIVDLRYVPDWFRPHLERLAAVARAEPSNPMAFVDAIRIGYAMALDPASPYQALVREQLAALGDYESWTNRKLVERSQSNSSAGKERHLYRASDGARAVAHTIEDGRIVRREILSVIDTPEGGKQLIAIAEERGRDGKVRQSENRSCFGCHLVSRTGRITTRLANSNRVAGRTPNLRPFPAGHAVPRW